MKIIKLENIGPYVTFWKIEGTGKPSLDKNGNINYDISPGGDYSLASLIWHKRDIYGINSIISGIKKVKVTYDEYDRIKKRENEIGLAQIWEENEDYIPVLTLESDWARDNLSDEEIGQTPFYWSSEVDFAHTYSDVTEISDLHGEIKEYYKTSEVLEVLEKWKKALEKWNDPEKKKMMIEEYERENKNK